MKRLFVFGIVFILLFSVTVFSDRTACLTNSDAVISEMLNATGLKTTQDCTSNFASYRIVVDTGTTAGVRTTAVPVILLNVNAGGSSQWDFTTEGCDTDTGTALTTGSNPGTLDDGVASNPTIYTSSGTLGFCSDTGIQSTPVEDKQAYASGGGVDIFYWDTSDTDATGGDSYEQKGVFFGSSSTSLWNDEAKRIFNNSIAHACPYCFDECSPPATGNWEINKTCNVKNQDINITGNVSIQESGFLNLTGSGGYLNFIGTNRFIFMLLGSELSLDISATIGKDPIT